MLIYQLIDVLISVLDHCYTLTTNNHHSSDKSYMSNHSSTLIKKLHSVIHTNIKHRMVTRMKLKKCNKHSFNNIKCNI